VQRYEKTREKPNKLQKKPHLQQMRLFLLVLTISLERVVQTKADVGAIKAQAELADPIPHLPVFSEIVRANMI